MGRGVQSQFSLMARTSQGSNVHQGLPLGLLKILQQCSCRPDGTLQMLDSKTIESRHRKMGQQTLARRFQFEVPLGPAGQRAPRKVGAEPVQNGITGGIKPFGNQDLTGLDCQQAFDALPGIEILTMEFSGREVDPGEPTQSVFCRTV